MPRSGAEARRRLQQAALELYQEHGFDRTTTAGIAARAGVNERTFFRHFPDKREVLFDGEADLRAALVHAVTEAADGLQPLDMVLAACRKAEPLLERNRPFAAPRRHVIATTPALRERDLAKAASLSDALADALRQRGVDDRLAGLAAVTGWAAFHQAVQAWIDDPAESLDAHVLRAFDALRALSGSAAPAQTRPED
ncbi:MULTISPECIES: TetR family transcriptional regulator [Streptomyces]|uniref:TetR family transcriptional regulator n=1 Tax=Streptomyces TaxID=1883 RepID=UPI0004C64D2C|nr:MULTISPECIES: TetR family transcriptional regulator [Streptomyces]QHF94532.1 TetR family transcriptional regulator [Streptomyces sp. NHF165]